MLLAEREVSKAVHLLTTKGLGDLHNPEVQRQMQDKHPPRKVPISFVPDTDAPRLTVDLEGDRLGGSEFRALRRHSGYGLTGARNEHYACIDRKFADPQAQSAIVLFSDFASAYASGELPPWYYWVVSTVKLVAPIKSIPVNPNHTPGCRPLSVGDCLKRAIMSEVFYKRRCRRPSRVT